MNSIHIPVLPTEVLHYLHPQPGQTIVDCTLGGGGHASLIVPRLLPGGRLLGLDQDPGMLELAQRRLESMNLPPESHVLVRRNFDELLDLLQELQTGPVDGILADLGFASDQMANPERGLSFQHDGPLDMRLDPSRGEPAQSLVQRLQERELADLFWQFGEERFSRRIARRIAETRQKTPIVTTGQLAEIVRRCVPRSRGHSIDPATRVFQALRIAVNDELGALDRLLSAAPDCLKPGGRLAIISFHSLEDRRVKQAFKDREIWEALTKKPIVAGDEEARENPRARSAKLRAAKRK